MNLSPQTRYTPVRKTSTSSGLVRERAEILQGKTKGERVTPGLNLGVKSIAFPCSSLAEENSTVANMVTIAAHIEASAVYRPAHPRRPKPKMYPAGSSSVKAPSTSRNLSGINLDALGYRTSSRDMAHMLHITVAPFGMK